jgi:hypothetical protein
MGTYGRLMMMMRMRMIQQLLCIWVSGFSWYQPTLSSLVELCMKGLMQARMLFHLIIFKSTF